MNSVAENSIVENLIKITGKNGRTGGTIQKVEKIWWDANVTHRVPPERLIAHPQLCTRNVIHAYKDIDVALVFNAVHDAGYGYSFPTGTLASKAKDTGIEMWKAKGKVIVDRGGGKVGCEWLTTIKKIPLPEWYLDIRCRETVIRGYVNLNIRTTTSDYKVVLRLIKTLIKTAMDAKTCANFEKNPHPTQGEYK